MKHKVFTFTLLLTMFTAMGAWAQNLPGIPGTTISSIWSSPQSTATEGRYRSNADDFIRPDTYTGVRFDKWFGLVSFLTESSISINEGASDAVATAGFATKAGKVYIGAFYSGNFWTWSPANGYTEQKFAEGSAPAGGVADKTYNVYDRPSVVPRPINNAALLIGLADMGFRLTYRTNHQSFNKDDFVIRTRVGTTQPPEYNYQLYKNFHTEFGYIAPQIAWAMAKNLTKNGIRPYVSADLVFVRNHERMETVGGTVIGEGEDAVKVTGEKISFSENHFDPSFGLGLGGYTFYENNGFRASFDFDYVLTFNIYNNDYSYVENGQNKTAQFSGTFRPGVYSLIEQNKVSNLLTPSLSGQWSNDRLAMRFKLNLPLTLDLEEKNNMNLDGNYNPIYNGGSQSYTVFIFRPDLRLALQYKIIPNRLTLNAGARIQATAITMRTIDYKTYDNEGTLVDSSKIHEPSFADNTGTGNRFVSRFSIGPTFNVTENVWVEANTGITNVYGDDAINIFSADKNLFSFGSILVALKF
jgi:hypothetical protein